MTQLTHPSALVQPLTLALRRGGGRGTTGRITAYHRGGGAKRRHRLVDQHRTLRDLPARVLALAPVPGRTAPLALLCYSNGVLSYILAARGLRPGSLVLATATFFSPLPSLATTLGRFPVGSLVHGVQSPRTQRGAYVRAGGAAAQVLRRDQGRILLKLRSGEHRFFPMGALASLGPLAGERHRFHRWTKAGQVRHLGFRPVVRGEAMNPVDHPHGGNTSKGRHPRTPWGKLTKGPRTRPPRKPGAAIHRSRHSI